MNRRLSVDIERWPVAGSFTIARGAKTHVDVVRVTLAEGAEQGRGEATPIYYHGESAESVAAALAEVRGAVEAGASRLEINGVMPRGAARNAIDAALWDLDAKITGEPVWAMAGLESPGALITAFTISLGSPEQMHRDAKAAAARYPLLKLKLAGQGDLDRVAAVRAGAPLARLIVDANEAWTGRDIVAEATALIPFEVELIEQPVGAGEDAALDGLVAPIPLCADESCQDRTDIARCRGRYQAINIKLDKAGGLTEALALADEARSAGFEIMVGCMLSTSLGVAPAFLVAQQAKWVDLDGPLLLARDRDHFIRYEGGSMLPPSPELWG
jgi:L-alanine-DL-glutamate epimerase-like enolase superfamily enzyme